MKKFYDVDRLCIINLFNKNKSTCIFNLIHKMLIFQIMSDFLLLIIKILIYTFCSILLPLVSKDQS